MRSVLCALLVVVAIAATSVSAGSAAVDGIEIGGLNQSTCNCPPAYPVCLLCPGSTVTPTTTACFAPQFNGYSCCGCVNGQCAACPVAGSCARYTPGAYNCPAPNFDSAAIYPCSWSNQRTVLKYGEATVLRCANVNPAIQSLVQWNFQANSDGQFTVAVLDQPNFEAYARGLPYRCLNPNCAQGGQDPKWGSLTAFNSVGFYVVITKTNQNFSGTSSYWMSASVTAA